jgi:hypothetical protein
MLSIKKSSKLNRGERMLTYAVRAHSVHQKAFVIGVTLTKTFFDRLPKECYILVYVVGKARTLLLMQQVSSDPSTEEHWRTRDAGKWHLYEVKREENVN